MKQAWLTGVRLVEWHGVERPLIRGAPHLLGIGEGPLRLEQRRTTLMKAGYAIRALACVLCFVATVLARRCP
ncbi:hypothetical protein ACLESO_29820 [Pyxidicoccus sp. 3LG]